MIKLKKSLSVLVLILLVIPVFADFQNDAFNGHWLLKSYADQLLLQKSTYETQERTGRMTELVFSKTLKDTVWVCYNNSEGAKYRVKFSGNNKAVFEAMNEKYELVLGENSGTRQLTCKGKDGYEEIFIFVDTQEEGFAAVNKWVNFNMLSGGYAPSIEMGMRLRGELNTSVWFKSDGTVMGIPGFDKYEILTHFDDIADFDVLKIYNSQSGKMEWLGWEAKSNRLILYKLIPADEYQFKKDEIFLQLERKE
ncbi:MAG: hypothetical protein K1X92_17635 [Bacteroidia bacterium]|nr:hypothetical protein [Bacteroidia bacterium]